MKYFFFFVLTLHRLSGEEKFINLEKNLSPFVLETFQIEIPNYPHAFNPSIVQWNNYFLLSFRVILDERFPYYSRIGLVWLNENFELLHEPQLLETQEKTPLIPSRAEDGRLLTIEDHIYLIYSNCITAGLSGAGFRMHFGKISYDGETFHLEDPEPLLYFEEENPLKREKNWVPFNYQGSLFLSYSLHPHLILHPIEGSNRCETIACSAPSIDWPWGTLRGGTPAIEIENGYLSFFHSSIKMESIHSFGENTLHYFMGAYIFEKNSPFKIIQISPTPIIAKGFYTGANYKHYWRPIQAIFPCGILSNEHYIWITYGRQDHECWIMKLDKKGLMKSLVQVDSCTLSKGAS